MKHKKKQMKVKYIRHHRDLKTINANVVIFAPNDYAVALLYDETKHHAPVIIDIGIDAEAVRMINIAYKHGIPIVQNAKLARSLKNVNYSISELFFSPIADILTYVYKIKLGVLTRKNKTNDTISHNTKEPILSVQIKDRLTYKESNQAIVSDSPLGDVLQERQLLQYFGDNVVAFNSANRRGYTCKWTIIDGKLYLTKFRSRSMRLHKTAQIFGTEPIYDLNDEAVKNMYGFSYEDTTQVKADWFSGTVVSYDREAENEEDLNGWEYTFKNGKLVEEKKRYVLIPGLRTAKKLRQYIED